MRHSWSRFVLGALVLIPAVMLGAPKLVTPKDVKVGRNLQTFASVKLSEQAPDGGLEVTLKSDDPNRLLFAAAPDKPGTPSITLKINAHFVQTPDFCVYGLADKGIATYTASAPGFERVKGRITLARSAILILGPFKQTAFKTTPAMSAKITLRSVILDQAGKFLSVQPVAGGMTVDADVTSSNPKVGAVSRITIAAGESAASTEFKPAGVGNTSLAVRVPRGFAAPSEYASVSATVELPGIGLTGEINLGKDLQVPGMVLLGEPAPEGGLDVTLTSSDASKLLLSADSEKVGAQSITLHIAAGENRATYHLQGLADSGMVTHTATGKGYRTREAPVTLAPSGIMVVYAPYGAPDRAEVQRAVLTRDPRPFTTSLAEQKPVHLALWSVYLDPKTLRGADMTAQRLRPGASATVDLNNSNPDVANVQSRVTLTGSTEYGVVEFKPLRKGKTEISIATAPRGFTLPSNATSVTATVNE